MRILELKDVYTKIGICSSSLMAVANLACNTRGQTRLTELGACEGIMSMMRSPKCRKDHSVFENGLLAMGNLAVVDTGQSVLLKNDAVGFVILALQDKCFSRAFRVHNQGLGVLFVRVLPNVRACACVCACMCVFNAWKHVV